MEIWQALKRQHQLARAQKRGLILYGPGTVPIAPYAARCAGTYLRELEHRKHRKIVLAGLLAWMLVRRLGA